MFAEYTVHCAQSSHVVYLLAKQHGIPNTQVWLQHTAIYQPSTGVGVCAHTDHNIVTNSRSCYSRQSVFHFVGIIDELEDWVSSTFILHTYVYTLVRKEFFTLATQLSLITTTRQYNVMLLCCVIVFHTVTLPSYTKQNQHSSTPTPQNLYYGPLS